MITCTPLAVQRGHLLDVVRALKEAPAPVEDCVGTCEFTMSMYAHECGTPACALGHYAAREDLQNTFMLDLADPRFSLRYNHGIETPRVFFRDEEFLSHFGIDYMEADRLFSGHGCGRAQTRDQAIEFIENFVTMKWYQWR